MIEENNFDILPPSIFKSCAFNPLPDFLVRDKMFLLKTWLMRHLPGKLEKEQKILKYCMSQARKTMENTFGILSAC